MAHPQGTVGRLRQAQMKALENRLGPTFQPIAEMAEHAMKLLQAADDEADHGLRVDGINALEKVCKYIMPQVKAMEIDVTNSDGSLTAPNEVRLVPVPLSQGKIAREDADNLLEHET